MLPPDIIIELETFQRFYISDFGFVGTSRLWPGGDPIWEVIPIIPTMAIELSHDYKADIDLPLDSHLFKWDVAFLHVYVVDKDHVLIISSGPPIALTRLPSAARIDGDSRI